MHKFVDNAGRAWTITINVAAIKRVRALVDVDLVRLFDDGAKPLGELLADPVQLANVLYCLCKDEADRLNVTDMDFGAALAGDCLAMAADAFIDELIDFFPHARGRDNLRKLVQASRNLTDKLLERAEAELSNMDIEREANRLIDSFGNWPASLESTPAHSPCGNSP